MHATNANTALCTCALFGFGVLLGMGMYELNTVIYLSIYLYRVPLASPSRRGFVLFYFIGFVHSLTCVGVCISTVVGSGSWELKEFERYETATANLPRIFGIYTTVLRLTTSNITHATRVSNPLI